MSKLFSKIAFSAVALAFSGIASAQSSLWDYGASCNPSPCAGNPALITANVSSWGTTSATASYTQAASNNQGSLGVGAQFGSETSTGGHHAFDKIDRPSKQQPPGFGGNRFGCFGQRKGQRCHKITLSSRRIVPPWVTRA